MSNPFSGSDGNSLRKPDKVAAKKKPVTAHLLPRVDESCEHDWPDNPQDTDCCRKCGMSFTRYIFTECP